MFLFIIASKINSSQAEYLTSIITVSGTIREDAGNCAGIIIQRPRRQSIPCGESGHGFVCQLGLLLAIVIHYSSQVKIWSKHSTFAIGR